MSNDIPEPSDLSIPSSVESSSDYNYKCPKCDGEFNTWDRDVLAAGDDNARCPFCGMEKGGFGSSL